MTSLTHPRDMFLLVREYYPVPDVMEFLIDPDGKFVDHFICGDGLAIFIVDELCDTIDPAHTWEDQCAVAEDVLTAARKDLSAVIRAIRRHRERNPYEKTRQAQAATTSLV